jgi:5-methylcytosine-specific restriction endonuclease McrA
MNLKNLKDQELDASFQRVAASERKVLHCVILHIEEVNRRKLYLARGYSSLFSYLTSEMKYSRSAAQRRIEAARLASTVPAVAANIESGKLNLSQLSDIQNAIKVAESVHQEKVSPERKAELIESVLNQSVLNTQQLCAEMLKIPLVQKDSVKTQKDHSKRIETTFSEAQHQKYERLKDLTAHNHLQSKKTKNISDVLETIFDELLGLIDPEKMKFAQAKTSSQEITPASELKWNSVTPKRRKIILKQQQSCQFKDHVTSRVCGSRFNLHVDHIHPKWAGGGSDQKNLRVLCREHNLYRYRRETSANHSAI